LCHTRFTFGVPDKELGVFELLFCGEHLIFGPLVKLVTVALEILVILVTQKGVVVSMYRLQ
jgi:hypothetical protein